MTRWVVLDAEAVTQLVQNRKRMRELGNALKKEPDSLFLVPAVVLTEVLTGSPKDAPVRQLIKNVKVLDCSQEIAIAAAPLRERAESLRKKKRDLTVDAIVAATAAQVKACAIITGDPEDFALLTKGLPMKVVSTN